MLLAVIRDATETAAASNGPFLGVPPWLVALVGAVVLAFLFWIAVKLLKIVLWVGLIVILVGGAALAAKLLIGP